eukprot:TRINITY_DN19498_c0_g2_i1.p1 TRINITY_DN19498_c0_g2~~TRINITY_DN19498_c0_g2_i1.p1  ORF type:complete len:445 (-),score=76.04 TRINITY_DN19498_c0_g2_i1:212-1546(-)
MIAICTAGMLRGLTEPWLLRRQLTAVVKPHILPPNAVSGVHLFYELSQEGDAADAVEAVKENLELAIDSALSAVLGPEYQHRLGVRVVGVEVLKASEEEDQLQSRLSAGSTWARRWLRGGLVVRRTTLLQILGWQRCYDVVVKAEKEQLLRYEAVIRHRSDLYWFLPMPSLAALSAELQVFEKDQVDWNSFPVLVPSDGSYDGVNDRFAVIPRPHMKAYLGSFEAVLLTGELPRLYPECERQSQSAWRKTVFSNITGPGVCGSSLESYLSKTLGIADASVLPVFWFPFQIIRPIGCLKQEPFVPGVNPCLSLPQPFAAQCVRYTCTGVTPEPPHSSSRNFAWASVGPQDQFQQIPRFEREMIVELAEDPLKPVGTRLIELVGRRASTMPPSGSNCESIENCHGSQPWLLDLKVREFESLCQGGCSSAMCGDPRCFFWQVMQTWP